MLGIIAVPPIIVNFEKIGLPQRAIRHQSVLRSRRSVRLIDAANGGGTTKRLSPCSKLYSSRWRPGWFTTPGSATLFSRQLDVGVIDESTGRGLLEAARRSEPVKVLGNRLG